MSDDLTDAIGDPRSAALHDLVRRNLKELRKQRCLSGRETAERVQAMGVQFDKNALASFESGRREKLSVEEFVALSLVLSEQFGDLLVADIDGDFDAVRVGERLELASDDWDTWISHKSMKELPWNGEGKPTWVQFTQSDYDKVNAVIRSMIEQGDA